jgi:hypothetical protein
MSSHDISSAAEFVRLTRVASEARDLSTLVCAQHQMRVAIRRALVSWNWSDLDEARDLVKDSPSLAARFDECLHQVVETPELTARGPGAHWHGLVLAIPVTLASREAALVSLPHSIATALRESLQTRFPDGTGIRLLRRLTPQLVAHSMGTRSLYVLVEELASGEDGADDDVGSQQSSHIAPHGRGPGRHYLFALAFTAHPEQLALQMTGDLRNEPGLVEWAAAQTESIRNDFAERGWQTDVNVSAPRRLRELLSLWPVLTDVREVDGLLNHVESQHGVPITMLRADLSLIYGKEGGLRIAISDRRVGTLLAHSVYRLMPLSPGPDAYRVAVRLASAGVWLTAEEDTLRRAVERALTLTDAAPASESTAAHAALIARPFGTKELLSRFSRSLKHTS